MMREHLCHGPVHITEITSSQNYGIDASFVHLHRSERNFQPQVETALFLIARTEEIRQRRRIALRARKRSRAKWNERIHRYHPWRKRSCKTLRKKRPERLIFPSLDVSCRRIVHQADS